MSPAKAKTPRELQSMSDTDLRQLDAHLKRTIAQQQSLRAKVGQERKRRRRARKVAP